MATPAGSLSFTLRLSAPKDLPHEWEDAFAAGGVRRVGIAQCSGERSLFDVDAVEQPDERQEYSRQHTEPICERDGDSGEYQEESCLAEDLQHLATCP